MKKIQIMIFREVMSPLLRRGGTMLATWMMATGGVTEDQVTTIINAILAAGFVGIDLITSYVERKR